MARKRKTQKKEEETPEEATPKKTTTKKSSKIKLTYSPLGFGAAVMSFPLKTREYQDIDGRRVAVSVPLIKGLPMVLTVRKGEVIEVTKTQYEELKAINLVESEEEYENRKKFIDNLQNQHPQTFNDLEAAENLGQILNSYDSQYKVFNDKLVRCD